MITCSMQTNVSHHLKKDQLSSPTMHGPELEYIKDGEKNWMSTVGERISTRWERLACETVGCKYAVALASAAPLPSTWP